MPTSTKATDLTVIASEGVRGAQVLMGCVELEPTLSFFLQRLQFRINAIFPADRPTTAMISGHGLSIRLVRGVDAGVSTVYLLCDDPVRVGHGETVLKAPNGITIKLEMADPPMHQPIPRPALVVTRAADMEDWSVGRAGMRYHDILPNRWGGAFIASQIRILDGGLVPDYEHFHKVRFQVIFCRRGWVRVAYEGQGEPIVMHPGDCVLQPPMIRHRVLESSPQAEVIEVGTPAEHITMADHTISLPNADLQPGRDFNGQQFVFHVAKGAQWSPWRIPGFECSDTGISASTQGLAGVRVVRYKCEALGSSQHHDTEFCFFFVLSGSVTVELDTSRQRLETDDSIAIPGGMRYTLCEASPDLSLLEVSLPGEVVPG